MGADAALESGRLAKRIAAAGPARDRWFFTGMALAAVLTVFVGFARSYYFRSAFGGPPLPPLVHLHGVLFTAWILLFVTQTSLVAASRVDLHRRLGVFGIVLAVVMVIVGYAVATESVRRGSTPGTLPPLAFLALPLGAVLAFAILVALGVYNRRRSETHKRLMLLATIALLAPAIARMQLGSAPFGPAVPMVGTVLFVAACVVYDRAAHGRVHPAFAWGGALLMRVRSLIRTKGCFTASRRHSCIFLAYPDAADGRSACSVGSPVPEETPSR
jgi:FtsH-binding integral membrane protein